MEMEKRKKVEKEDQEETRPNTLIELMSGLSRKFLEERELGVWPLNYRGVGLQAARGRLAATAALVFAVTTDFPRWCLH